MEACKRSNPDLLIIEGTRVDEDNSRTETNVEDEICNISTKANGLLVCNWWVRDTDRMLSFLDAAKKMNKKLAISLKQAYLLDQLSQCPDTSTPRLDDDNIEIYANRKSWGLIGSSAGELRMRNQDYDTWERQYLDRAICYKEVKANQKDYLMFCTNFDLKELIDIAPAAGSVYIKSVCEPFDAEMEIDWERIQNWIGHFGLDIASTHVSGHATGTDLRTSSMESTQKLLSRYIQKTLKPTKNGQTMFIFLERLEKPAPFNFKIILNQYLGFFLLKYKPSKIEYL